MNRCYNCMEDFDGGVCPHCGFDNDVTSERLDSIVPGTIIRDRYLIGNALGRGGFGITYIAWDETLQRKVAIKEYLPRGLASRKSGDTEVTYDDETKETFDKGIDKTIAESRKLAGFTNLESVVTVFDCFKKNNTAYIVMELLEGENIKERLKKVEKFSWEETLGIMTPVLNTLSEVHKTGIIHRDISPDNIFLCNNGRVKLLDFGSARIAEDADEKSRSIILKHGYAPKEQYTSRGKQGTFTDMYAVCATMYKMLTGITPEDSIERISDEDELRNISEIADIPGSAARAIMKGLNVRSDKRIQSAGELLSAFNEKYEDISSHSEPVSGEDDATVTISEGNYEKIEENVINTVLSQHPVPAPPAKITEPAAEVYASGGTAATAVPSPAPVDTDKKIQAKKGRLIPVIASAAVIAVAAILVFVPKSKFSGKINNADSSDTATQIQTAIQTTAIHTTAIHTTATTAEETTTVKKVSYYGYIDTHETANGMILHKSPGSDEIVGLVDDGEKVGIIEKAGEWCEIKVNEITGFVRSEYISTKKPVKFTTGEESGGVYYNEWLNLQFEIPTGWLKLVNLFDYVEEINFGCPSSGCAYGIDDDFVVFIFLDSDFESIMNYMEVTEDDFSIQSLGGQKYSYVEITETEGILFRKNTFNEYYFRQIGDKTVLIMLYSEDETTLYELQQRFDTMN